jgi:hypothetical protein
MHLQPTVLHGPAHVVTPPGPRTSGSEWWQINVQTGSVIDHLKFPSEQAADAYLSDHNLTPKGDTDA